MASKEVQNEGMKDSQLDGEEWLRYEDFQGGSLVLEMKLQSADSTPFELLLYVSIKKEALDGGRTHLLLQPLICSWI